MTSRLSPPEPPHELHNFMAWVRAAGLQKNNRFFLSLSAPKGMFERGRSGRGTLNESGDRVDVEFTQDKLKDIVLACDDISIPQKQVLTRSLRLNGLNEQRAHTVDYGNSNGLSISFLVDNTHLIQEFFDAWMGIAVNPVSREIGEYKNYISTLGVIFLRPTNKEDEWAPYTRGEFVKGSFKQKLKERAMNMASDFVAGHVDKLKSKLKKAIKAKTQSLLGKQLKMLKKLKKILPLDALFNDSASSPSDIEIFVIQFDEVFPTSISSTQLSNSSTDVFKITVNFTFKKYHVGSVWEDVKTPTGKNKEAMNFLKNFAKKSGIPTTKSQLGKAAIGLIR